MHERDLWDDMRDGAEFFAKLLHADIPRIAVENPVMHKYAREIIGRGPDFTCQPWQFGDKFKKRTCFWLSGLAPLVPCDGASADDAVGAVHRMPPSADRGKLRSKTYPGMAREMIRQWAAD